MGQFLTIFLSVFIAEVGDKTQLATLLFASNENTGRLAVFIAAGSALLLSTLLAVLAGGWIARTIQPSTLKILSGVGFVLIGMWTLWSAME
jgi:putative Ca2+/H+ antiporter (TMEM165/GDT1 family)